jgi:hypothetical protein
VETSWVYVLCIHRGCHHTYATGVPNREPVVTAFLHRPVRSFMLCPGLVTGAHCALAAKLALIYLSQLALADQGYLLLRLLQHWAGVWELLNSGTTGRPILNLLAPRGLMQNRSNGL